ncbi:hypothetical protein Landi51_12324 [Colletotrichum acutatum]
MAASTLRMGRMEGFEGFEGLMGKHGVKWLVQNRRSALKLEAQLQSPYDDLVTDREPQSRLVPDFLENLGA